MWCIQFLMEMQDEDEACKGLEWAKTQVDFLGGRVIEREGRFFIQAFFTDVPGATNDNLPDGCRRVLVPDALHQAMGIANEQGIAA